MATSNQLEVLDRKTPLMPESGLKLGAYTPAHYVKRLEMYKNAREWLLEMAKAKSIDEDKVEKLAKDPAVLVEAHLTLNPDGYVYDSEDSDDGHPCFRENSPIRRLDIGIDREHWNDPWTGSFVAEGVLQD
ncbi:hypothetical protein N0V87_001509 [Didymella glomerata]|uniref:Uncharacterized protein n=1 Tax=Didymella glomerata TaxID=749621 RepID=A0A9W9C4G1_9PLEO|nr:hypothetical protein N0V87_001509 [Didymella glomerata]